MDAAAITNSNTNFSSARTGSIRWRRSPKWAVGARRIFTSERECRDRAQRSEKGTIAGRIFEHFETVIAVQC
jgi:hypothetical protein